MQLGSQLSTASTSKPTLGHVNPHIVCGLCHGYLIDATTLTNCLHSFCRSCLLKHLRSTSKNCPSCRDDCKTDIITDFRRDRLLQRLVYKLVPGLYRDEINQRNKFNTKTGANTSTENSRRDYSPRIHNYRHQQGIEMTSDVYSGEEYINVCLMHCDSFDELGSGEGGSENEIPVPAGDRRYLQCPARFTVGHLKKYLQFKFGIENKFEVDMFIGKLSLEDNLSLIDVAYSYYNKKVPDVTLQYVVSVVQSSAVLSHGQSIANGNRPSSPVAKQTTNHQPAMSPTVALTATNRARPLTVEMSPLTTKLRTPTSRIRKRMINDAFSTNSLQNKTAKIRCQVDEDRSALARSDRQNLSRQSADELVQVESETDQLPSPILNPDTSERGDYSMDSIDDDVYLAVDKRMLIVTNGETSRQLNGVDLEDNMSEVMSAALKTFVADSACVLTVNDIDRLAASGAEKWMSKSTGCVSVVTRLTDTDIVDVDDNRVHDDLGGDLSEGSSDIDGEIRKIAADVTCSSHDDDINSVMSDDDHRCCSLSMTGPYGSENLEPSVGFETIAKKPSVVFECTVDGSDIATQMTLSASSGTRDDSTSHGDVIDRSKLSPLVTHMEDSSMLSCNLNDPVAQKQSSVPSNQPKSNQPITCLLGSSSAIKSVASSINVILSSTYMSTSTTSPPTSILKTLFGHSTNNASSLDTRVVSCVPLVHRQSEESASTIEIGSPLSNISESQSYKNCYMAPVKLNGISVKMAADKPECPEATIRSTASVENLVSSSTDSIASQSAGENAVSSANDVTGDLLQQQKRLTETLLLNKGNFSAAATFSTSSSNVLEPVKSIPCTVRTQLQTTLKLNGGLSIINDRSTLIKRVSDASLVRKITPVNPTPNDMKMTRNVTGVPATATATSGSTLTPSIRPSSCVASDKAGTCSSHASVGTQTNTDLLGRYFRRRMNPVNSFIPGSNGRHLRSTNLTCNGSATAGLGLRDRMARAGFKTTQATVAGGSTFSFSTSTTPGTSSTAATANTVYFTSGPQGNPVIVPVPTMTPVNINNKGTFLIALPANFTLPSSAAGGIICPTVSVSSIGGSKVGTAANAGGTLTVCPVLLKTGSSSVATSRTTAVVINRSVSGPPLQVMVTPSPVGVGLSSVTGIKSVQTLNKCLPISQSIRTVTSGSISISDRMGLRGFSRIASGPRLSKELSNGGTLRFERLSSTVEQVQRSSDNTILSTSRQTAQAPTIIYCSRPLEIQGQVQGQKPDSQMSPQSTSGDNNSTTVSVSLASKEQPTSGGPVMSKVAVSTKPATSQLVTPETGLKGLISSPVSVAVTRVSGARHTFIANMPQLIPQKRTPSTASSDVANTSQPSTGDIPIATAVCSGGQRMEGAPVSFIRAILERSIASPAAYGSYVDDERCSISPDHVTSTAGNGDERSGPDGGSVTALTIGNDVAPPAVDANCLSNQLSVSSVTKSTVSDLNVTSPMSVSPTVKRSSSYDADHPVPAAKRSRQEPTNEPANCAARTSSSSPMTSSYSQPTITMESILAKYAKQQNASPPSVTSLSPKSSSPGNACNEMSAVCSYRDDEVGKQLQAMQCVGSARITRSGMVALPKKIYAYLGSAMSHEHIANQLVPGSPSPTNNGCSMDSSDGLVPASPTNSATSGRLSIESITSSDDGPIRQLRMMCNGLQNAVQ